MGNTNITELNVFFQTAKVKGTVSLCDRCRLEKAIVGIGICPKCCKEVATSLSLNVSLEEEEVS